MPCIEVYRSAHIPYQQATWAIKLEMPGLTSTTCMRSQVGRSNRHVYAIPSGTGTAKITRFFAILWPRLVALHRTFLQAAGEKRERNVSNNGAKARDRDLDYETSPFRLKKLRVTKSFVEPRGKVKRSSWDSMHLHSIFYVDSANQSARYPRRKSEAKHGAIGPGASGINMALRHHAFIRWCQ